MLAVLNAFIELITHIPNTDADIGHFLQSLSSTTSSSSYCYIYVVQLPLQPMLSACRLHIFLLLEEAVTCGLEDVDGEM